jgi:PKD domain
MAIALSVLTIASLVSGANPVRATSSQTTLAAFTYEPCLACLVTGNEVFFNANWSSSVSGKIVSYTWNFGDGSAPITNSNPGAWHNYSNIEANVTLTVADSLGSTDTITQLFVWNIVPRFTFVPLHPAVGEPIVFNASSSKAYYFSTNPITGYSWNFGDGNTGSNVLTKHAYTAQSLYRTSLTLLDTQNPSYPIGNPTVSETVMVGPPLPPSVLVNKVFDGVNITATGSFLVNSTAQTLTGQATVTVTNATNGAVLFSKTFDINLTFGSAPMIRFVLVASIQPFRLGVSCVTDTTSGDTHCIVSRNPDVDNDGRVDIIDVGMLATRFDSTPESQNYLAVVDLSDTGTIGIIDAGIMFVNFGATLYQ